MEAKRNTWTAALFLLGLAAGVLFLLFGVLPQRASFRAVDRPARSDAAAETLTLTRQSAPADRALRPDAQVQPLLAFREADRAVSGVIDGADPAINKALDRDNAFIELYGGIQRLLGRSVIEDVDPEYTVVKLPGDVLSFANLDAVQVGMDQQVADFVSFQRLVQQYYDIPMLYVQAPHKLDLAQLPEGVSDYSSAEADQFLAGLAANGVDTLDLRPAFREALASGEAELSDLFFRTDHHWTPAGAFLGYQAIYGALADRYGLSFDPALTDPDSFDRTVLPQRSLGSQGKRVGSLYAGLDDFELWAPKFETRFHYTASLEGIDREGPFERSLLFPERLAEDDVYEANDYTIYAGGDYSMSRAVNEKDPDGPRILVIRDSFGCALTPFLSLGAGEVITMDPRAFSGDPLQYIGWLKPDVIVTTFTTSSLRLEALWPFFQSAGATNF